MFTLLIGVLLGLVIFWVGLSMLRMMANPVPEPEEGELRRVNLKYRCSVCGTQVKMTQSIKGVPEAPRHCMEEMTLEASSDDI